MSKVSGKDLEDGFYWIRLGDDWTIGERETDPDFPDGYVWYVNGVGGFIFEEQIAEVDPNRIVRNRNV